MQKPGLLLLAAFLHGLIYVFLMLPWQHYDEPSHFEYVWIVAQTHRLPETAEADLAFRQDLVRSMLAHAFYDDLPAPDPGTLQPGLPILGLQYSQLNEPPLYYLLASLPVMFLQGQPLHLQLYAARLISLLLFVLTILAIWGLTTDLTSPKSRLPLLVPLLTALLPGLVELMTAVNNDVGATTVFSWFLWGGVRFLKRGASFGRGAWVLGTALLCLLTKSTVFLAAPLALLVFFLSLTTTRFGKWVWGLGVAGVLAGIFLTMTWQEAAFWHRAASQPIPTRTKFSPAPHGDYVLEIQTASRPTPAWLRPLYQPISPSPRAPLTLGVWMWTNSPEPVEARTPTLSTPQTDHFLTVQLTSTPTFYAFSIPQPERPQRLWLTIFPAIPFPVTIYYDGFVLAEGTFLGTEVPQFTHQAGTEGTWGGKPFQNLLRNPSAETAQPAFRPEVDNLLAGLLPDNARPSMLLTSLLDFPRTAWYYRTTAQNLLETFWGRFGWGHIPLAGGVYRLLGWFTVAGVVGGVSTVLARRRTLPVPVIVFLGVATGLVIGVTFLRGAIFIFVKDVFIPGARYALPALGPVWFLLVTGWKNILAFALRPVQPRLPRQIDFALVGLILAFLVLNGYAILTILRFNG